MVDVVSEADSGPGADALLAAVPGDLSDDGVGAHLIDLHALKAIVDAKVVETTDVFDKRAVWSRDGARNGPGWVAARTGASYGSAKADQDLARDLRAMPGSTHAFGPRLSRDQTRLLAKARTPDLAAAFDACEDILVAEVARLTVAAAARFLHRWAAEVRQRFGIGEPDGPEPPGAGSTSKVHLSCTFDSRWRLDGDLTGEDGEIMRNVIDAQVDAMWRDGVFHADDGLSTSERFATALVEVLVRGSQGGDDDGVARPLLVGVVHVNGDGCTCSCGADTAPPEESVAPADRTPEPDAPEPTERDRGVTSTRPSYGAFDAVPTWDLPGCEDIDIDVDRPVPVPAGAQPAPHLPSDLFGLAELEHAGLAAPHDVGRWLCEGTLQILHVDDDHDELRMGRRIRTANRAQRRALRVRDGGCVFPGCSVAASYCVAHHVRWWGWEGPTDIENLVLLCRFHHKTVHARGFLLTRTAGRVHVTRPDGMPLTASRPTRPDPTLRPITPIEREPEADTALLDRLTRHRADALIAEARRARAGP